MRGGKESGRKPRRDPVPSKGRRSWVRDTCTGKKKKPDHQERLVFRKLTLPSKRHSRKGRNLTREKSNLGGRGGGSAGARDRPEGGRRVNSKKRKGGRRIEEKNGHDPKGVLQARERIEGKKEGL